MNNVYELVIYEQAAGVTDEMVREQSRKFQELIKEQNGLLSRKLSKSADGKWLDCVLWESMEDAVAAAKVVETNEEAAKFMEIVKAETVSIVHYSVIDDYL